MIRKTNERKNTYNNFNYDNAYIFKEERAVVVIYVGREQKKPLGSRDFLSFDVFNYLKIETIPKDLDREKGEKAVRIRIVSSFN